MQSVRQTSAKTKSVPIEINCITRDLGAGCAESGVLWLAANAPVRLVLYRGRMAELVNGRPEFLSEEEFTILPARSAIWITSKRRSRCCPPSGIIHIMPGGTSNIALPVHKEAR